MDPGSTPTRKYRFAEDGKDGSEETNALTPHLLMQEAEFGTYDADSSLASFPVRSSHPHRSLRGQIRATFLAALAWKRWLRAVTWRRASVAIAVSLRPLAERPLRIALAVLRTNTACRTSDRAAARLLRMVLRGPVMRASSGAFSTWRAQACSIGAAAEAKLQNGLRELELQRRLRAEAAQRPGRLTLVLARVVARRRGVLVASAFAAIVRCSREVEIASMKHSSQPKSVQSPQTEQYAEMQHRVLVESCKGAPRLAFLLVRTVVRRQSALLASAFADMARVAERASLAAEISNLTATDAQLSAEFSRALTVAKQRARQSAVLAGTLQLRHSVCRRLGSALRHLRVAVVVSRPTVEVVAADAAETGRVDPDRRVTPQRGHASQAAPEVAAVVPALPDLPLLEVAQPLPESAFTLVPLSTSDQLRHRADALLRLKVRLSLRKDFSGRVWAVPVTPSLRMDPHARLSRGAACLLEYVLASAVRMRQRLGLNAFLVACRMQVEHEVSLRRTRAPLVRPQLEVADASGSQKRHVGRNRTPSRT